MCNHDFKKTQKKEISYCTKCGNLSYKNIPSLSIQFNSKYLFEIDPFLLKFKHSKKIIDFSNNSINKYLNFRNIFQCLNYRMAYIDDIGIVKHFDDRLLYVI